MDSCSSQIAPLAPLICAHVLATSAAASDFKTASGKVFQEAEVVSIAEDGIQLKHREGVVSLPISELPDEQLMAVVAKRISLLRFDSEPDIFQWGMEFTDELFFSSDSFAPTRAFRIERSELWLAFEGVSEKADDGRLKFKFSRIQLLEEIGFDADSQPVLLPQFPEWISGYGLAGEGEYLQWIRNGQEETDGIPAVPDQISEEVLALVRERTEEIKASVVRTKFRTEREKENLKMSFEKGLR